MADQNTLFIYTSNTLFLEDVRSADVTLNDPCGLVGGNSVFWSTSWANKSFGQYGLTTLATYGKPVFLALAGSTPDADIAWVLSNGKKTLGSKLRGLFLRDEPRLEGGTTTAGKAIYDDLQREINTIRAIDPDIPIILNTTANASNYVSLQLSGLTANCIDNYLNRGTSVADIQYLCQQWRNERNRRKPSRKLAHIGMMHNYSHPPSGTTFTMSLSLYQQMYNAVAAGFGESPYMWGLYAWRNTAGNSDGSTEYHPRQTTTVRAPTLSFASWYQSQTLSGHLTIPSPLPASPAAGLLTVSPLGGTLAVGGTQAVTATGDASISIISAQLISGSSGVVSFAPAGLRSWTVTATAEGTATYRIWQNNGYYQDAAFTVTGVTPEPPPSPVYSITLPPGTKRLIIEIER